MGLPFAATSNIYCPSQAEISPILMALVGTVYMGNISEMKTSYINTTGLAGSAWLMLVKIPMGLSSISRLFGPLGLMAHTPALEKSFKEW